MFKNKDVASGFLFVLVSLAFGLSTLSKYSLGMLSSPGPGLVPMVFSSLLFLVGVATLGRGIRAASEKIIFRVRSLGIVMLAILSFVVVTKVLNMVAGIFALIFIVSLAIPEYSIKRNLLIVVGLVTISAIFKYGFGVDLPLI